MSNSYASISPPRRSEFALRFFAISTALMLGAGVVSSILMTCWPIPDGTQQTAFPRTFAISTLLLLGGSRFLSRATRFVQREKQLLFRKSLAWASVMGMLFVGVQTYALRLLIVQLPADEVPTGAAPFVAVVASLHAMHFVVAMFFLVFVSVQAFADRYDHEYHWGVTVCAWFWHALGIVWCVILGAMFLASF